MALIIYSVGEEVLDFLPFAFVFPVEVFCSVDFFEVFFLLFSETSQNCFKQVCSVIFLYFFGRPIIIGIYNIYIGILFLFLFDLSFITRLFILAFIFLFSLIIFGRFLLFNRGFLSCLRNFN